MKIFKILFCICLAIGISSCDQQQVKKLTSRGNVKIVNNEAILIGEGRFTLKDISVEVTRYKLFVNGRDYGSVPDGASTVLHVYTNGSFVIYVNDERRYENTASFINKKLDEKKKEEKSNKKKRANFGKFSS